MLVRLLLVGIALCAATTAQAKSPPRDILGLRLGMTESEVHQRLARMGLETGYGPAKLEKLKELWEVRHPKIASIAIRFDEERRLKWITAFAKPDGKRLRYRDLADLEKAERLGFHIYVWKVPAQGGNRAYSVMARGSDPDYLGNYALYYETARRAAKADGGETP